MLQNGLFRNLAWPLRGRGSGRHGAAPAHWPLADHLEGLVTDAVGPGKPAPDAAVVDDAPIRKRRAMHALGEALSPSHPVADRSHLFGRERELDQLFRTVTDLRAHAFLYGARGQGKTSLARAFGDYADERGVVVIYLSCESGSSFAEIFRPYLDHIPDGCFARENLAGATRAIEGLKPGFRPRALAGILSLVTEQRVVLIVDEFDRVSDTELRGEVATLLKLMSDMRAQVHLLLVGIARDAQGLVEGHESLRRHLVAIGLGKFGEASSAALLDDAERRSGLRFEPASRHLVTSLAAGSPYHLRLFAFCAGIATLEADERDVRPAAVVQGLRAAFDNWAELNPPDARTLVRAAERGPAERRMLEVLALAALDGEGFTAERVAARSAETMPADAAPADAAPAAAAAAITLVSSALTDAGDGGRQFRDTLAPQFLLLACCFADERDGGRARQ